jgi:predicted dehydrogenase
MDFLQRKPTRSAKFICADGEIVWDGIRNKVKIFKGDGGSEQMLYDQFSVSIEGTYEIELAEFLHHCFERTPSQDQIVHGQKVMKLIDQLRQSITTNRTVRT